MKFIKTLNYNAAAAQFMERVKKSDSGKLLWGAIVMILFAGGIVALAAIFMRDDPAFLIYIISSAVGAAIFFAFSCVASAVFIYNLRYPLTAVIDDEHLFLRKGRGYIKMYKLGFVSVTYTGPKGVSVSGEGAGGAAIEIRNNLIRLKAAELTLTRNLEQGQKLAYILIQTARNPKSGVNWGAAYDSLPENKRTFDDF